MTQKKRSASLMQLVLIAALVMLPTMVMSAESPWDWKQSLLVDVQGDSLYMPSAVAFDSANQRYYAVDTGRSRLVSFDKDGKLLRAFTANDQLKAPFDMVRLDTGQLWVVEKGRNSLTYIDVAAKKLEHNTLKDGGRLVFPDRIAEWAGKLYVLDRASGQILQLDKGLSVEQRFHCSDCSAGFADFSVGRAGIVALEPRDKQILRFSLDGQITSRYDLGDSVEFPVSLAVDSADNFYVLDRHQNRIFVYDEGGRFQYSFLGGGQAAGKVYFPSQVRFDPWGRLCVVDEGNGRIEIFGR